MRSLPCVLLVVAILVSACTTKKAPGDACRAGAMICGDAASIGSCRGFTWHVDPCRGPGGCASGVCDQSLAEVDDTCSVDGAMACSLDGKSLLKCERGTMTAERTCRGDRGCYRTTPNAEPSCDQGPAQLGDACTVMEGGGRCSADGTSVLQCSSQTHHMILERNCRGPKGCFKNSHFHEAGREFLGCDVSMGDVGQPCIGYAGIGAQIGNGGRYCSADGKQLLTCKNGVLAMEADCACNVTWTGLESWSVECANRRGFGEAVYLSLAEKTVKP